jgi:hypothetical protein
MRLCKPFRRAITSLFVFTVVIISNDDVCRSNVTHIQVVKKGAQRSVWERSQNLPTSTESENGNAELGISLKKENKLKATEHMMKLPNKNILR